MSKPKYLIGLGGLKQSGKSTIARALYTKARIEGIVPVRLSFATPMRMMVRELLNYADVPDRQIAHYLRKKNDPIPELQNQTMRHILQTLGTEWGRDTIGTNLWTSLGMRAAKTARADLVIFDDVRFASECDAIIFLGGHVVRLVRDEAPTDDGHSSEAQAYMADMTIQNNKAPHEVARLIWLNCGLPEELPV